jgi:hypothetical protein
MTPRRNPYGGVGDGALDDLLEDGGAGLRCELQKLERLGGVAATDEVRDHPRFSRCDPCKPGAGFARHGWSSFLFAGASIGALRGRAGTDPRRSAALRPGTCRRTIRCGRPSSLDEFPSARLRGGSHGGRAGVRSAERRYGVLVLRRLPREPTRGRPSTNRRRTAQGSFFFFVFDGGPEGCPVELRGPKRPASGSCVED